MRIWSRRGCRQRAVVGVFLIAALLFSAVGCDDAVSPERAFSYAEQGFSAMVSGCVTRLSGDGYAGNPSLVGESLDGVPRPFSAVVAKSTDAAGRCTLRVAYTAPAALAGMVVTQTADATGGAVTRTLTRPATNQGSIHTDLSEVAPAVSDALLAPVTLLLPCGDVCAVSPIVDGCLTISRSSASANGQAGEWVFTFSDGELLPTRVTWNTPAEQGEMTVRPAGIFPILSVTPPSEQNLPKIYDKFTISSAVFSRAT